MKNLISKFYLLLLLLIALTNAHAEFIETSIIQIKMNRFYFSHGTESEVIKDADYKIILNSGDTLKGKIEFSSEGISYSYKLDSSYFPIDTTNYHVWLDALEFDRVEGLLFGAWENNIIDPLLDFSGFEKNYVFDTIVLNPDSIYPSLPDSFPETLVFESFSMGIMSATSETELDMWQLHDDGYTDIIIDTKTYEPKKAQSALAPFIVTLIPNLSKKVNEAGLVTTALYYGFEQERISNLFNDITPNITNNFIASKNQPSRFYYSDHNKGRKLFNQLRKVRKISFFTEEETLKPVIAYFADILSLYNCRSEIAKSYEDADIWISKISSVVSFPLESYKEIITQLNKVEIRSSAQKETIEIIEKHINSAENEDLEAITAYQKLIEQKLLGDIGVFPIYRPTVYMTVSDDIRGVTLKDYGKIELDNVRRLKEKTVSEK